MTPMPSPEMTMTSWREARPSLERVCRQVADALPPGIAVFD